MSRPAVTPRARRALLLAVAALVPFAPGTAHAQLGKLIKKAAQGAAQGAIQGEVKGAADGAPARAESRGAAPIAISSQSIDALLSALGPTAAAAAQYESARARHDAQRTKHERHRACRDTVHRRYQSATLVPTRATMDAQVAYGTKVAAIMERYTAATQAGKADAAQAMLDSAGALGEAMENDLIPALKQCGAYVPTPGESPRAPDLPAPQVPPGMTPTQFGLLRERVAAWLLTDGAYKVGPDEKSALEGRAKDLAPLGPLFRGHTLRWTSWGDLTAGSR